ncbi:MAG TPA: DUF6311 domain-containing protein [Dokdonella sp.]
MVPVALGQAHTPHRHAGARLAWLAFACGLAFAALTLAGDYVLGRGPYWQVLFGDVAKGEIGWFYYARDTWQFPLFATSAYHTPEGSSMVLSDSLPLFALPAKLLYRIAWPVGSAPPIYSGLWVALCLVLQAVAASRVLRVLGVVGWMAHLAGIVLFCYLPIVFLRFGQTALMGQFVILLALEGYLRAKRSGLTPRQWIGLCALPPLVLFVHPYLAAMCGALVAATILDQWRERRYGVRGALLRFGGIGAGALLLMGVGGFFAAASSDFGDYGLYSMNLLSPWVPFPQTLSGSLLHTEMAVIEGTNQWEGGAYLGAGVFLLCAFALPALRDWRANTRRHAVLLAMLLLLLAFAISHRIGLGSRELVRLPLPDALLHLFSQFRGSGRFVWVAVYALLAALIVAVVRRYDGQRATLVLVVAALLQVADAWPMQRGVRAASASTMTSSINVAAWTQLIETHQRIFEFPSFECGGLFGREIPGSKFRELEFDWIAAQQNKPTNSAYLARFTKDCTRERLDALAHHDEAGVLYLYRSSDDIGSYLLHGGIDLGRCGYLDDVVVCSGGEDLSALR